VVREPDDFDLMHKSRGVPLTNYKNSTEAETDFEFGLNQALHQKDGTKDLVNIAFELDYGRLSDDMSSQPLVRMCKMHKSRDVDDLFQQVARWLEEPGVLPDSLAVETFALMSRGHMLRRGDTLA